MKDLVDFIEYNPDTGIFIWKNPTNSRIKVGDIAGTTKADGYIIIRINGKNYRAHRLAWFFCHGYEPTDQIDHINGKRDDNRIINLREVSKAENAKNQKRFITNTSGVSGVSFNKTSGKWIAQIVVDGVIKYLGSYECLDEASNVVADNRKAAGFHENHGKVR